MQAPRPAVSIVLPTYNQVEFVRAAVASVQSQTTTDWELIIVDDGSTEAVRETITQLGDDRIRFIGLEHSGLPARVRNAGIAASTGEWIAFLDADDVWHPEKLAKQLDYHHEHPEHRWSYTGLWYMQGSGEPMAAMTYQSWKPVSGNIVRALLRQETSIVTPSVFASRDLLKETGRFEESLRFAEDYDMWLRLARRAECGVVPQPLAGIRRHQDCFTYDQVGIYSSFARVYERFAGSGASREERRICRSQESRFAVHLARQSIERRNWRMAARALARALRLRPIYPRAWGTLAKGVLRFLSNRRGRAF